MLIEGLLGKIRERKNKEPHTVANFDPERLSEEEKQEEIKRKLRQGTFDNDLSNISLDELNREGLSELELKILQGK